jgi:hypothetical protein
VEQCSVVLANEGSGETQENREKIKRHERNAPLKRVLKVEGVGEESKKKLLGLRNNIRIVKLTEAIIKIKRELDKA